MIVNNQIDFTARRARALVARERRRRCRVPIFLRWRGSRGCRAGGRPVDGLPRDLRRDVVIDMYAYRRRGRNGGRARVPQPLMYRATRRAARARVLPRPPLEAGRGDARGGERIAEGGARRCRRASTRRAVQYPTMSPHGIWRRYQGGPARPSAATSVPAAPRGFLRTSRRSRRLHVHPKIERGLCTGEMPRTSPTGPRAGARLARPSCDRSE
jgi:hypothetical protein